jgi:hypothetical protein
LFIVSIFLLRMVKYSSIEVKVALIKTFKVRDIKTLVTDSAKVFIAQNRHSSHRDKSHNPYMQQRHSVITRQVPNSYSCFVWTLVGPAGVTRPRVCMCAIHSKVSFALSPHVTARRRKQSGAFHSDRNVDTNAAGGIHRGCRIELLLLQLEADIIVYASAPRSGSVLRRRRRNCPRVLYV